MPSPSSFVSSSSSRRLAVAAAAIGMLVLTGCVPEPEPTAAPTTTDSPSASAAPTATSEPTTPSSPSASASPSPSPSDDGELRALADTIGVTDFELRGPAEYVVQWGIGSLDGSEVRIYEFASEEDFNTYLDSVVAFGITREDFVREEPYAVAPTDRSQLERIRAALS
ncbi:hypothetical protein M4I32_09475 [Microbacterium sp. LRZ72]|uniref:hypothetical protein n=1 Tax=Microbacterium sp. LRZ72 TaxID=2942481 RepID=UPI0029BBF521|nr:hypothetical protein [Microbacterium sp. LRZ72]MDX2377027.1 hypothetical protein [Microbacterium sp. LRZ72]